MLSPATRTILRRRAQSYNVHGACIVAQASDWDLLAAVDELLSPFITPVSTCAATGGETTREAIFIEIEAAHGPCFLPSEAHAWLDLPPIRLSVAGDEMFLELDGTWVATLSAGSRMTVWIPTERVVDRWTIAHYVLQPLLMEAMRTRGLMMIHAAALADGGRVVLFPAESGSGKTTLTLALLRAGFRLLSDDSPFLCNRNNHLQVCAFPERVNVMEQTSRYFPELHPHWLAGVRDLHRAKVPLDVTEIYGECTEAMGVPGAIIFPKIGKEDTSTIAPIGKTEALFRLLPLTGCSPSPAFARAQFELVSRLVHDVSCLTLRAGRDFDALPQRIGAILSETAHSA